MQLTTVLLALAAGQTPAAAPAVNPQLWQRLSSEAMRDWIDYESKIRSQYSGTSQGVVTRNDDRQSRTFCEMRSAKDCLLWQGSTIQDATEDSVVQCYNAKYCFKLTKEAGKEWRLDRVTGLNSDSILNQRARAVVQNDCDFDQPITAGTVSLKDLFLHPSFKCVGLSQQLEGEGRFVQMEFTCIHDRNSDNPLPSIPSGVILLDPDHHWYARSGRLRLEYGKTSRDTEFATKVKFEEGGLPLPVRWDYKAQLHSQAKANEPYTIQINFDIRRSNVSANSTPFTLSAFGLSEPAGTPPTATPVYVWLLIAAGVAAMLAIGFGWLRRRATRPPVSTGGFVP